MVYLLPTNVRKQSYNYEKAYRQCLYAFLLHRKRNIRYNTTMKKAHLIGICGKGMAGLAVLLKSQGYTISGSDEGFYDPMYSYLTLHGITFTKGYASQNIPVDTEMIIIGKHAKLTPESNEEVHTAFSGTIPVKSFPEIINELTAQTHNIVVAGSFGKSTCTALISWCLRSAGKDPSYFIGATPYGFTESAYIGTSDIFVLEGDEYPSSNWDPTSKFLYYNPRTILLTSGEHDHINIFPTLESYLAPFKKLVTLPKEDDCIIACGTGAHMDEILTHTRTRIVTYSLSDTRTDWYAEDISYGELSSFMIYHRGTPCIEITTTLLGSHNMENIVGCVALLLEKKLLTKEEIIHGVRTFKGVEGRLDRKESDSSVIVFEGFGSSHAKLTSLFDALTLHYPSKKIVTVFEPHTFSWRNRGALSWYSHIFSPAHTVLVFDPPTHGAHTQENLSLEEIVEKISEHHPRVFPFRNKEEGLNLIQKHTEGDDIILLVTSGDLGGIIPEVPPLVEKLFPRKNKTVL